MIGMGFGDHEATKAAADADNASQVSAIFGRHGGGRHAIGHMRAFQQYG